jgi:hypothetical protein
MPSVSKFLAFAAAAVSASLLMTTPSEAKCTRLAFSVNDYGKEGPTKDAKALLDQHIAKVMAERGIKKYSVGKKEVTCELFLDLILFDEHTCKAAATVCWPEGGAKPSKQAAQKSSAIETGAVPAPAAKKAD